MKCADVSNPTKEWNIYERWYKLIIEETLRQGDKEKSLNLPVSPYMDRDTLNIPSAQTGFMDFIVRPLFESFDHYSPIPNVIAYLQQNRDRWSKVILGQGEIA